LIGVPRWHRSPRCRSGRGRPVGAVVNADEHTGHYVSVDFDEAGDVERAGFGAARLAAKRAAHRLRAWVIRFVAGSANVHIAVVIGLMSFNADNWFFGGWTVGSMDIGIQGGQPDGAYGTMGK